MSKPLSKAALNADAGIAGDLARMRARADAWRTLEADPDLVAAKLIADAWRAAFVQPKTKIAGPASDTSGQGITHATLRTLSENPASVPDSVLTQINDLARQYRFFHWHLEFPGIFAVPDDGTADPDTGWNGGFSCVLGNPPWERVKIQDKEFFGNLGRTDIETAANAAIRKKMIEKLTDSDPALYRAYRDALRQSDGTAHLLLKSGRYPLTGRGDVNTYSVFAETMRTSTGPTGTAGIITPTGLATDKPQPRSYRTPSAPIGCSPSMTSRTKQRSSRTSTINFGSRSRLCQGPIASRSGLDSRSIPAT
jgi:hypothetical protein